MDLDVNIYISKGKPGFRLSISESNNYFILHLGSI